MVKPTPNGPNGRDERGRFAPGNVGGPGNPHAKQVGKLRSAMLAAVSDKEMKAVVKKLVELAKGATYQRRRKCWTDAWGDPSRLIFWNDWRSLRNC